MQNRPSLLQDNSARPAQKVLEQVNHLHQGPSRPARSQAEKFLQADLRNQPARQDPVAFE